MSRIKSKIFNQTFEVSQGWGPYWVFQTTTQHWPSSLHTNRPNSPSSNRAQGFPFKSTNFQSTIVFKFNESLTFYKKPFKIAGENGPHIFIAYQCTSMIALLIFFVPVSLLTNVPDFPHNTVYKPLESRGHDFLSLYSTQLLALSTSSPTCSSNLPLPHQKEKEKKLK